MGIIIHLKGRSRCFGLDKQFEFARFSECQTQSVQKAPLYVCVPPSCDYPKGFQHLERTLQRYALFWNFSHFYIKITFSQALWTHFSRFGAPKHQKRTEKIGWFRKKLSLLVSKSRLEIAYTLLFRHHFSVSTAELTWRTIWIKKN